jgi:hypothetical protein
MARRSPTFPLRREENCISGTIDRVRGWRPVLQRCQSVAAITQGAPGLRVVRNGGDLVESVPGQPDRACAARPLFLAECRHDARGAQYRHDHTQFVEFELK